MVPVPISNRVLEVGREQAVAIDRCNSHRDRRACLSLGGGYAPDGLANEALHWIVGKSERLGLDIDAGYLNHFTPCFNSKLNDSMSLKYRVFGEYVRPMGRFLAHGETVHQAPVDRRALFSDYRPENLEVFLTANPGVTPAQTTRIPRGTPCEAQHLVGSGT